MTAPYSKRGNRILCEFTCHCDRPYIYVWLNIDMDGNFIIKCPNCSHKHYRVVKGGIITEERFDENYAFKFHTICPVIDACQVERRHRGLIAEIREKEAVGAHC